MVGGWSTYTGTKLTNRKVDEKSVCMEVRALHGMQISSLASRCARIQSAGSRAFQRARARVQQESGSLMGTYDVILLTATRKVLFGCNVLNLLRRARPPRLCPPLGAGGGGETLQARSRRYRPLGAGWRPNSMSRTQHRRRAASSSCDQIAGQAVL